MTIEPQPNQGAPSPQHSPSAPDQPSEHHYQHSGDETELERLLNSWLKRIEPYSNQILLGFIVFTVLLIGGIWWLQGAHASQSVGWQQFASAQSAEDFAALAEEYPDTELASWARLQQARRQLSDGLQTAMTNRTTSDEGLKDAQETFKELLRTGKNVPPEVREEALYGMATCLEALSDGDTEPAIKAYEELLQAYPDTQHRRWAERRIEVLRSTATQEFYAWFRQQDPSPTDRPQPNDFSPGSTPPLNLNSGGLPDFPFPSRTGTSERKPAEMPPDLGADPFKAPGGSVPPAPATPQPLDGPADSETPPASAATPSGETPRGTAVPADSPGELPAPGDSEAGAPEPASPPP